MIIWEWRTFAELTPYQLYDVLQLRELVFTIGQKCSDPDLFVAEGDVYREAGIEHIRMNLSRGC